LSNTKKLKKQKDVQKFRSEFDKMYKKLGSKLDKHLQSRDERSLCQDVDYNKNSYTHQLKMGILSMIRETVLITEELNMDDQNSIQKLAKLADRSLEEQKEVIADIEVGKLTQEADAEETKKRHTEAGIRKRFFGELRVEIERRQKKVCNDSLIQEASQVVMQERELVKKIYQEYKKPLYSGAAPTGVNNIVLSPHMKKAVDDWNTRATTLKEKLDIALGNIRPPTNNNASSSVTKQSARVAEPSSRLWNFSWISLFSCCLSPRLRKEEENDIELDTLRTIQNTT
jgi:hypothetical protein